MITVFPLYPLKFKPILKQKVWGGDKLGELLNKNTGKGTGESWEISGVAENVSVVSNGPLKGKSLTWLLENYREKLVGQEVYERFQNTFPLLFKFIDASKDLSVQVHPDDQLAEERHQSFGKTEMWYILQADTDSRLILGFSEEMDRQKYLAALAEKRITQVLNSVPVKKGDAFILQPGTVHAIGAGIVLAEIQQTSDITYRIYDWDRPDNNGEMRQLHTELALDAIDFQLSSPKLECIPEQNLPQPLGRTDYFVVNNLQLSSDYIRNLRDIPSFAVYMCIDGRATIETDNFSEEIKKGETLLVPAQLSEITFIATAASFLEVYIP